MRRVKSTPPDAIPILLRLASLQPSQLQAELSALLLNGSGQPVSRMPEAVSASLCARYPFDERWPLLSVARAHELRIQQMWAQCACPIRNHLDVIECVQPKVCVHCFASAEDSPSLAFQYCGGCSLATYCSKYASQTFPTYCSAQYGTSAAFFLG